MATVDGDLVARPRSIDEQVKFCRDYARVCRNCAQDKQDRYETSNHPDIKAMLGSSAEHDRWEAEMFDVIADQLSALSGETPDKEVQGSHVDRQPDSTHESRTASAVTPSAHTPGPWEVAFVVDGAFEIVATTDGDRLQVANRAHFAKRHFEFIANARLIAAAPEMYEALNLAERFCPCGARPESLETHPHVGGCLIAKAIEKAEGRSSEPDAVAPTSS